MTWQTSCMCSRDSIRGGVGDPSPVPQFKRLAYGACRSYLDDPALRRAVLLSGPRRVGKTTVLQQLAAGLLEEDHDPRSILYLSLDHPLLKLPSLRTILTLYHEQVYPENRPVTLLLDEVQYARDWETEVKLLVDYRPQYRILATGSASIVQRTRLAESGVGRWLTVPMPTLSFYEFVHIRGEAAPDLSFIRGVSDLLWPGPRRAERDCRATAPPCCRCFSGICWWAAFPRPPVMRILRCASASCARTVVERVLKRDMTALFGVRNITELEKLFIYLCLHTGGILAHKTVADALETSTTTVGNHLALLEQAHLIYRLPPAGVGGKKILKARHKYYLVDAALRNAVLLRGEEVLTDAAQMGLIVETTVLRHLYAYYYRDTPEIAYWRDAATNREVDVIVPQSRLPVAL